MKDKNILFITLGLVVITMIIFIIIIFELYSKRKFIFAPYVKTNPSDSFLPLGNITELTQLHAQGKALPQ